MLTLKVLCAFFFTQPLPIRGQKIKITEYLTEKIYTSTIRTILYLVVLNIFIWRGMFKVKQMKIEFLFEKMNENCDLSLRKRISSCQNFPLNFFPVCLLLEPCFSSQRWLSHRATMLHPKLLIFNQFSSFLFSEI